MLQKKMYSHRNFYTFINNNNFDKKEKLLYIRE